MWLSVPQRDVARTRTTTCPGPADGLGTSSGSNPGAAFVLTNARTRPPYLSPTRPPARFQSNRVLLLGFRRADSTRARCFLFSRNVRNSSSIALNVARMASSNVSSVFEAVEVPPPTLHTIRALAVLGPLLLCPFLSPDTLAGWQALGPAWGVSQRASISSCP